MTKIYNPQRRIWLKATIAITPSFAFPSFAYSEKPANFNLLEALKNRLWLEAGTYSETLHLLAPSLVKNGSEKLGNPVIYWGEKNLDLIRKYRINPLRAARTLSYLMASIHDTVVTCVKKYGASSPHATIAVHFAAGTVIDHLFPDEVKNRWIGEGIMAASSYVDNKLKADWDALWSISQEIAQRAIRRALVDGSARINAMAQPPKTIALAWKATPPLWSTRPAEPGAPGWKPWLAPPKTGEQCAPPLTLTPELYEKQIEEVYRTHQNLTPDQKVIAESWNLELGTVTPPGVWVFKTIEKPAFLKLSLIEQTGLLSMLTTAMMDAFTACWYVKFKWWTERPITAIRRLYDPNFLPHIITPSFPSYTSGHATVSGAAATILSNVLPQFQSEWQACADEAAISRLYGGIHFRFDNEEGLALGKKVGELAILEVRKSS